MPPKSTKKKDREDAEVIEEPVKKNETSNEQLNIPKPDAPPHDPNRPPRPS